MSDELNTMPELTLDPTGAAAAAQAAQGPRPLSPKPRRPRP